MATINYGSGYSFSPRSTGMAFGQPRGGVFGTQALPQPQQPPQAAGQAAYSPAARPQQPQSPQPQQPQQQAQQPSALSSYLQQYRGQPNYFEGTPPPQLQSPAQQPSAIQQQLAPAMAPPLQVQRPTGPPEGVRDNFLNFSQWMAGQRPNMAEDLIRDIQTGKSQYKTLNDAYLGTAREMGYSGPSPSFAPFAIRG